VICCCCCCCCRWGYKDIAALEEVVDNYTAAAIPLECLWLDIEHQGDRFRTLSFNQGAAMGLMGDN
jgi:alpha-glucosidase (family GH31 glycosyl hydrolase)